MARRPTLQRPRPLDLGRRLVDLLGPTGDAARQSLVALVFNSSTSLVAGALLGAIVTTFEELPEADVLCIPGGFGVNDGGDELAGERSVLELVATGAANFVSATPLALCRSL